MTGARGRRASIPEAAAAEMLRDAEALLDLIEACETAATRRNALWVRLSTLPRGLARPHHLRLARAALEPVLGADRGRLFRVPGASGGGFGQPCDLVAVWRGPAPARLPAARHALALLFEDHAPAADAGLALRSELASLLVLPDDAAMLRERLRASLRPPAAMPRSVPLQPLDAPSLAALEALLATADLSRFARRGDVCAWDADRRMALRWERRFPSVAELFQALRPDRDPRADPWLFRRLTRALDRRMLALLAARGELDGAGPFEIGLNVGGILSPEFLRFDAALPAGLRGGVVLGLRPEDAMADPAAFVFARDFARARGYRLLLRGLDATLLRALPPARMGVDFIELRWSEAMEPDAPGWPADWPVDPACVVLSHANTPAALEWGRRCGIGLYRGAAVSRGRRAHDAHATAGGRPLAARAGGPNPPPWT